MAHTSAEKKRKRAVQAGREEIPAGRLDSLVAVLESVRRRGPCTRGQIVAETGLSRAVVAQRVVELTRRGLIEDGDRGPSSGGRAPRLLRFRASGGHLLVADLGATSMGIALTDLGGEVLDYERTPMEIADGPTVVLARVRERFAELSSRAGLVREPWGIGIGIPGPVEFSTGLPVAPPIMPGWDQFPIRGYFGELRAPVWVDNDANLLALGEYRAGVGRGHETMIFIKIGTGIGAGIIVNGRLHRGAQGSAGDIGHVQITDDPSVVCRCGNIGCLEAVAGGGAIARAADTAAREGRSAMLASLLEQEGRVTAVEVGWAAAHGDQFSVELIARAGRVIGAALASLVNVLNPSLIVIGGGVSLVGDLLLASIRQAVYGRSLPLATRSLTIVRGELGLRGGVIGAAGLVADQLFSTSLLSLWAADGRPVGRPELADVAQLLP
jgi:glucokinase-like ROK family protein